jgi:hypothetical protein
VRLLTEGTLRRGVNPSGTTVPARGWARMRLRPLVDVALTGTALYQPCMVCSEDIFRPRLGASGVPLITVPDNSKKEDQLMTAAFGTRPKRRLNRVMDALDFEYPDYSRLDKDAEGQKRKRVAGALNKDDEDQPKKKKLESEPKKCVSKKRKALTPKQKAIDEEEGTSATPSATEVEEILKVMTESLPVKLSPLGPHLTKLF